MRDGVTCRNRLQSLGQSPLAPSQAMWIFWLWGSESRLRWSQMESGVQSLPESPSGLVHAWLLSWRNIGSRKAACKGRMHKSLVTYAEAGSCAWTLIQIQPIRASGHHYIAGITSQNQYLTRQQQRTHLRLTLMFYCGQGFHFASWNVENNLWILPHCHVGALALGTTTVRDESSMTPRFIVWKKEWFSWETGISQAGLGKSWD